MRFHPYSYACTQQSLLPLWAAMKLRDANLQVNEKNSFTDPPSCIFFHFLRIHHGYFFRRVFESVLAQFLSGNDNVSLDVYFFMIKTCLGEKKIFQKKL